IVADLIILEVVGFHLAEEIYDVDTGYIIADKLKPVSRLAGADYAKLGTQFDLVLPDYRSYKFMEHLFREGKTNHPVFIMLHGTGGNETNLLPLGEILDPEAAVLAIRGDVVENGMLRYFKRKEEGVYDVEDLNQRGEALHQFIVESS